MSVLTWKNVNTSTQDISGAYREKGQGFKQAFQTLSDSMSEYEKNQQEVGANILKQRMLGYDDKQAYNQAIKSGSILGGLGTQNVSSSALDMLSNHVDTLGQREAQAETLLGLKANRELTGAKTETENANLREIPLNAQSARAVNSAQIRSSDASARNSAANAAFTDTQRQYYGDKTNADIALTRAQAANAKANADNAYANAGNTRATTEMNQQKHDLAMQTLEEQKAFDAWNAGQNLKAYRNGGVNPQEYLDSALKSNLTPAQVGQAIDASAKFGNYDYKGLLSEFTNTEVPSLWKSAFNDDGTELQLPMKDNGKTVFKPLSELASASEAKNGHVAELPVFLANVYNILGKDSAVERIGAINDDYHKGTGSAHNKGSAADFTLKSGTSKVQYAAYAEDLRNKLAQQGLKEGVHYKLKDEANYPSSRATADHLHFELLDKGRKAIAQDSKVGTQIAGVKVAEKVVAATVANSEQAIKNAKTSQDVLATMPLQEGQINTIGGWANTVKATLPFDGTASDIASWMTEVIEDTGVNAETAAKAVAMASVPSDEWFTWGWENMLEGGVKFDRKIAKQYAEDIKHGKFDDKTKQLSKAEEKAKEAVTATTELKEMGTKLTELKAKQSAGYNVTGAITKLVKDMETEQKKVDHVIVTTQNTNEDLKRGQK